MEKKNKKKIEGTEDRNKNTNKLDEMSIYEVLSLMNSENKKVIFAIEKEIPQIEKVIKCAIKVISTGGKVVYIGAGTSGRLGVLDASECPPTFGVSEDVIIGIIAGGDNALKSAIEGAEDDKEQGAKDLKHINLTKKDMVIGIAASGKTPYVIGALEYAKNIGCHTVAIVNNVGTPMKKVAEITVELLTGAEVLTGSTRLKAGTAQKMVLNMISTTVMVAIGKVYENLMVDVKATNKKLQNRAKTIVMQATNVKEEIALKTLLSADGNPKLAILMILTKKNKIEAEKILKKAKGYLRKAITIGKNDE